MVLVKMMFAVCLTFLCSMHSFFILVSADQGCNQKIGIEDRNLIPDNDFEASSTYRQHYPHLARLNLDDGRAAWCFEQNDTNPYLKVKLPAIFKMTRISIQGRNSTGQGMFVKRFKLESLENGAVFPYYKLLEGNTDKTNIVNQDLKYFSGNAITIKPISWYPNQMGCLRFQLYGCKVQVDECKMNNGGCLHNCNSSINGPICSCKNGYILDKDGKTCTDIDECKDRLHGCEKNTTFCFNNDGGYDCYCRNQSLTKDPKNRFKCIDKNECKNNNGNCGQLCINTLNGYRCGCTKGYILNRNGRDCDDIDECKDVLHSCEKNTTFCFNNDGGYDCHCRNDSLTKDPKNRFKCIDKNECKTNNGNCEQRCINTMNGYRCGCNKGYSLNKNGRNCDDIDECTSANPCNTTESTCNNTRGSFDCKCFSGLKNDHNDRTKCININECKNNNGNCDHICTDNYRSYKCSCKPNFYLGNDKHTCIDKNECLKNNGNCDQFCINFDGGYRCDCKNGYKLDTKDYRTCHDIDECAYRNGGCEKFCNNTDGSFFCSCNKGYRAVGKFCFDIDECKTDEHNCSNTTSSCINTHGSFECRCNSGYSKDAVTGQCKAKTCSSLTAPINGNVSPASCLGNSNDVGYRCNFGCNKGYKLSQQSATFAYCNSNGYWMIPQGSSPECKPIRCSALSPIKNGYLLPSECGSTGISYKKSCVMDCFNGYDYVGSASVTCQADGTFRGNFSSSKCVPLPKIQCPADKTVILPFGKRKMQVFTDEIVTNVAADQLRSIPDGILDNSYEFSIGYTFVKIIAVNEANKQTQCSFHVLVQDKESPLVHNCTSDNQYITIDGNEGIVKWNEPSFSDNSGTYRKHVNLKNGVVRQPQVYYVEYTVKDDSGNTASCRFFVHVQAKFCSIQTMPGGYDVKTKPLTIPGTLLVFLECPQGKTFSHNITDYYAMAKCFTNGAVWAPTEIPSCVGFSPLATPCPAGTQLVRKYPSTKVIKQLVCANCVKGSFLANDGKCQKCSKGYYQDEEGQTVCKMCPSGSKTLFNGATEKVQCKALCDKGSFSVDGLKSFVGCTKCPIGSYQSLDGQMSCNICPEGGKTIGAGASHKSECYVAARIIKIVPDSQQYIAFVGDTVAIECSGMGSPLPYVSISTSTALAPESLRGTTTTISLPAKSEYVSAKRMTIKNVQIRDSGSYKCSATNQAGIHGSKDERQIDLIIKQR